MIRTERLLLRRARMGDAADMHRVLSDPGAMRYWSSPPFTEIGQTRQFLAEMIGAPTDRSDDFILERDGCAIGKAGVWMDGEIGIILHPDHWGQGLAREALGAAIPHAFGTLDVDRLTADVDPRNAASLRLLENLGFRETGRAERTIRVGGEWCDSVYLELLRDRP